MWSAFNNFFLMSTSHCVYNRTLVCLRYLSFFSIAWQRESQKKERKGKRKIYLLWLSFFSIKGKFVSDTSFHFNAVKVTDIKNEHGVFPCGLNEHRKYMKWSRATLFHAKNWKIENSLGKCISWHSFHALPFKIVSVTRTEDMYL